MLWVLKRILNETRQIFLAPKTHVLTDHEENYNFKLKKYCL